MGWFRGYYDRYNSDPRARFLFFAALIGFIAFFGSRFLPVNYTGIDCDGLTQPRVTGNNQSILASQVDPSVLTLELVPDTTNLRQGEALGLNVRLLNASMAPLTIYFADENIVLRYTGQEPGLVFAIQRLNGTPLGEAFSDRPQVAQPQAFERGVLRLLGPRSRCTVRIEVDAQRLARIGFTTGGQYRVVAVYRNTSRGQVPAPAANTPTPIFNNQGVWIGEVRSNDVIINVVPPGS